MKNITLAFAIVLGFCATEAEAQARTRQGSNLLGGQNRPAAAPAVEEVKTAPQESEEERVMREKKEAEKKAERELWSTWPQEVGWANTNIVKQCEEKFGVVFFGENNDGWTKEGGKALIEGNGSGFRKVLGNQWKKIDSNGILTKTGAREKFEEYVWMTNTAARIQSENQTKWAEEHRMTLEEARLKRDEFVKKNKDARKSVSIRERRIRRQREAAEKAKEEN